MMKMSTSCTGLRFSDGYNQVTSSIPYIALTVSLGLMADTAAYGILVPVLAFRLESVGYTNVPATSSYRKSLSSTRVTAYTTRSPTSKFSSVLLDTVSFSNLSFCMIATYPCANLFFFYHKNSHCSVCIRIGCLVGKMLHALLSFFPKPCQLIK
jgi:hypothetical protein